jgi:hypothetical protein
MQDKQPTRVSRFAWAAVPVSVCVFCVFVDPSHRGCFKPESAPICRVVWSVIGIQAVGGLLISLVVRYGDALLKVKKQPDVSPTKPI